MTRIKKLKLNTVFSLINQVVTLVCGFILPRFVLKYFGSNVNGLVSSISQLLGLISLCELGVGAVVQSSLYKPLVDNDNCQVSRIMVSAKKFFDKIGFVLLGYVIILIAFFPLSQLEKFDFMSTAFLIMAMSISFFAQYFFGIRNQILINADQRSYVQLFYQIITVALNTVVSIFLIKIGTSIQIVKLSTSIIYLIRPIGLYFDVKKHYHIDYKINYTEEPIKQKWNGLAQHFATVVSQNTDTVILTFFSTLTNVSIYNVYYLVVNGIKQVVLSLTTGVQSLFGNMLARDEKELLNSTFESVEWLLHAVTVVLFTITGMLIVPFVKVYTSGVTDANYIVPIFAILITSATASYCLRLPYSMMVLAAGHYKQTQSSAIIEMLINIVVSISLVFSLGLIGVAIGTLVSMTYRTVYYVIYLKKNILCRNIMKFIKLISVDLLVVAGIVLGTFWIKMVEVSYISWVIMALKVCGIGIVVSVVIHFILCRREAKNALILITKKKTIS